MQRLFWVLVVSTLAYGQTATNLSARAAARFLDQATWGPTPDSIAALQQVGIESWLASQFATAPSDRRSVHLEDPIMPRIDHRLGSWENLARRL